MEFVLNKIMSIDKDAEKYRKGIDELIREKQKETDQAVNDIRLNFQEEAKIIKETILKNKLQEAEERAESIRQEKEAQLSNIRTKYNTSSEKIVNDVFNKIINSL